MCGIWAIINQEEAPFDYQSFCTLGCANDRRGGDSCGVFIDGEVEYGIDKKSKFEDFFWDSNLLNNTAVSKIALGHDRKASKGGISLDKAHPIIIKEPVKVGEGEEPKEEIKFVMVHNGTIHNEAELAKKYIPDIDIKDMSDSQILARLIYYSGFDFLAEYNGGTAFIAVDYREKEPKVLIWRGEAKKYSTSTAMEEERPLFCNLDNNRLVLSSIPSYLAIVDGNCYTVPANKVLTYRNNKLYIVQEIDRTKAQQNAKYDYYNNNNYYHGNNVGSTVPKYIRTIVFDNRYKIGDLHIDGYVRITTFGKILSKYDSCTSVEHPYSIYFFDGIPLRDKKCYTFLCKAFKRTKLTVAEFTKMYQNLIRYFSIDQLYFDGELLYKAVKPWKREPYTGYLQMLTEAQAYKYVRGYKDAYAYKCNTINDGFAELNKQAPDYDFKTIWKEFIQSMG